MRSSWTLLPALAALLAVAACDRNTTTGPTEAEIPSLPEIPGDRVIFFEDFDDENDGVGVNNWTAFRQWNVLDGCVDLHGNGFYDVQRGHGLYVDLDGSCNHGGTIETREAVELQPGIHVLEFWLAGNQRLERADTVRVTVTTASATLLDREYEIGWRQPFRLYSERVDAASPVSVRIRFQNHGGDNQGALLDVIRLRRN